jgi:cytochrome P450
MASMFFYLSRHPDVLAKVSHEVRTRFVSREDIRLGPALSSCRYLRACIDECLRISPPVGAALLRDTMHGGATVDGHFLPEGVTVGIGIYSMHHTEAFFPKPFEFLPDRWLIEDAAGGAVKRPFDIDAYGPFSMGPRSCIGKALALAEVMLAMAAVCWSLEFRVAEGLENEGGGDPKGAPGRRNPGEFQLYDHITSAKYGPMIQFRTRMEEPLPN